MTSVIGAGVTGIAADLALALDPARIGALCGLQLDGWQAALLRSDARHMLLLCARQCGKSTVTGLLAIVTAITKSGALILILAPSQRQAGELFRTVLRFLKQIEGAPEIVAESALRCELSNKSRIVALPSEESNVRGFAAVDLVIMDEAARCTDELYQAVRPMLAATPGGGRMILLSSPAGRRGFFFNTYNDAGNDWHKVRVSAAECPRISPEWLAAELKELGLKKFESEYGLVFHDADEAMFSTEMIDRAFTADVRPLWG